MFLLFLVLMNAALVASLEDTPRHRKGMRAPTPIVAELDYASTSPFILARIPWDWEVLERFKEPIDVGLDYGGRPNLYQLGGALGQIHMRYKNMSGRILGITARKNCRDLLGPRIVNTLERHLTLSIGSKSLDFLERVRTTDNPRALLVEMTDQTAELGAALRSAIYYTSGYISLDEKTGRIIEHRFIPTYKDQLYWAFCFCTWRCCRTRR